MRKGHYERCIEGLPWEPLSYKQFKFALRYMYGYTTNETASTMKSMRMDKLTLVFGATKYRYVPEEKPTMPHTDGWYEKTDDCDNWYRVPIGEVRIAIRNAFPNTTRMEQRGMLTGMKQFGMFLSIHDTMYRYFKCP